MQLPDVEQARADEYPALMDLFDTAFRASNPNHTGFAVGTPDLYHPTRFRAEDHLVVRDAGRPVAGLGIFPLQFAAGPNAIETAGIGSVSTHPDHRTRGCMTALLQETVRQIERRGYTLSYLGGDRLRYGRYGWEAAGYHWRFQFSTRYLTDVAPADWRLGEPGELAPWMHEAIAAKPYRRIQSYETMQWAVRRYQVRMLAAEGPAGRGVVVYSLGDDAEIRDWGGAPSAILALIAELARRAAKDNVYLNTPAVGDDLTRLLARRARRCLPQSGSNLRICRLRPLLEAYLPWLSRAANLLPDGLTLRITDAGQEATLVLGSRAAVADVPGRYELALTRLEMTALLFGPLPPSRALALPSELACLDAVLPLPFFVSGISNV